MSEEAMVDQVMPEEAMSEEAMVDQVMPEGSDVRGGDGGRRRR